MKVKETAEVIYQAGCLCESKQEWVPAELSRQLLQRASCKDANELSEKLKKRLENSYREAGISEKDVAIPWIEKPANVKSQENEMKWSMEVLCGALLSMEQYDILNTVLESVFQDDECYQRILISLRQNECIDQYLEWVMLHVLLAADLSAGGKLMNGGYQIGNYVVKMDHVAE